MSVNNLILGSVAGVDLRPDVDVSTVTVCEPADRRLLVMMVGPVCLQGREMAALIVRSDSRVRQACASSFTRFAASGAFGLREIMIAEGKCIGENAATVIFGPWQSRVPMRAAFLNMLDTDRTIGNALLEQVTPDQRRRHALMTLESFDRLGSSLRSMILRHGDPVWRFSEFQLRESWSGFRRIWRFEFDTRDASTLAKNCFDSYREQFPRLVYVSQMDSGTNGAPSPLASIEPTVPMYLEGASKDDCVFGLEASGRIGFGAREEIARYIRILHGI